MSRVPTTIVDKEHGISSNANSDQGTSDPSFWRRMGQAFGCLRARVANHEDIPQSSASGRTQSTKRQDGYDTLGTELDENARIWKVFRTQVTSHDQNVTIRDWNATLDVLLVFAALFLGVVTSFVIQTYPAFPGKGSAQQTDSTAQTFQYPSLFFVMMGLWLVSLMITLVVSLFCILAKQWLQEYSRRLAVGKEDARHWAYRRWIYKRGLDKWNIDLFATDGLPLLLHTALFLFAAGLVILLSMFQHTVSWLVGAIAALLLLAYIGCTLSPIYQVDAPTSTPLLRRLFSTRTPPEADLPQGPDGTPPPSSSAPSAGGIFARVFTRPLYRNEESYIKDYKETMEDEAIQWLLTSAPSEEAFTVAFSAISALKRCSSVFVRAQNMGVGLADAFQNMRADNLRAVDVMRVIRSELYLRPGDWNRAKLGLDIPESMLDYLMTSQSADAGVLLAAMQKSANLASIARNAAEWREMGSSSLPSTIQLLLTCERIDARAGLYLMLPLRVNELCAMRDDFSFELTGFGSRRVKSTPDLIRNNAGEGSQAKETAQDLEPHNLVSAIVILVQITAKFACTYDDFLAAAHLAARIVRLVERQAGGSKIQDLVVPVPWERQLRTIHPTASNIFAMLHSRDPILGWCRTQGRLLHAIVSNRYSLDMKPRDRLLLGYHAGFVLESLLNVLENKDMSLQARDIITSLLVATFLDTHTSLEEAIERYSHWQKAEKNRLSTTGATGVNGPSCAVWPLVQELQLPHATLLRLAVTLAASLCSVRRGATVSPIPDDVSPTNRDLPLTPQEEKRKADLEQRKLEFERRKLDFEQRIEAFASLFLGGDVLRTLLSDSSRVERVGPSRAYIHLAQHCVELEEGWCRRMARRDGDTDPLPGNLGGFVSWCMAIAKTRPKSATASTGAAQPAAPASESPRRPPAATSAAGTAAAGATAGTDAAGGSASADTVIDRFRLRAATRYFLADKLESKVASLGPCRACPGPPPSWPRNYPRNAAEPATVSAPQSALGAEIDTGSNECGYLRVEQRAEGVLWMKSFVDRERC